MKHTTLQSLLSPLPFKCCACYSSSSSIVISRLATLLFLSCNSWCPSHSNSPNPPTRPTAGPPVREKCLPPFIAQTMFLQHTSCCLRAPSASLERCSRHDLDTFSCCPLLFVHASRKNLMMFFSSSGQFAHRCVPRVVGFMILGSCRDHMTQSPDYPLVLQLHSVPLTVKS